MTRYGSFKICAHTFNGRFSLIEAAEVMGIMTAASSGYLSAEIQNPDTTPLFLLMCTIKNEFCPKLRTSGSFQAPMKNCRIITDSAKWAKVVLAPPGIYIPIPHTPNTIKRFRCRTTSELMANGSYTDLRRIKGGRRYSLGKIDREIINAAIATWVANQI